jgi:hypothetical protein
VAVRWVLAALAVAIPMGLLLLAGLASMRRR